MSDRTCGWCGGSMEGKRSNALYCSTQHKKNAASKRHRERNPGYYSRYQNTPRYTAYMVEHAGERRAYARKQQARYRQEHPSAGVAWLQVNPDYHRLAQAKRRTRKRSGGVFVVTDRDIARLLERWRYRCAYCGTQTRLHLDHVVPLARGGRHSIGNLLPACQACNQSKNARLLADWLLRR